MSEPALMTTGRADDTPEAASTDALAIAIRDLHVDFRVYAERKLTMRELVGRGFRSRESFVVEAVAGVTLDIAGGEAVGIVGTNGSGKSTLLRAIAGLQSPTKGRVLVRSQPHLLGVAPALSAGLSGRRNIELGALAMGMRMDEVAERMDEVIDFSGLRKAIDRPLNTYSSGMRARLAFSIATLQTPDILLIDEALAVGDRRFKRRSLRRVRQIQESAGTILMVTHNLNEIRAVCGRTIWMADGRVVEDGPTADVLERYVASDDAED